MNVEIFVLYLFSRNSRLRKVRKILQCVNNLYYTILREYYKKKKEKKKENLSPRVVVNFLKNVKFYTCKNICVHSKAYEGLNLAHQKSRKLGVFGYKVEGSFSLLYYYYDIYAHGM